MLFQGNCCLYRKTNTLVTLESFPASVSFPFSVILSVSLLKKVGKNIRKNKRKYAINLLIAFIISILDTTKNASEIGGSFLAFQKNEI